ncbi:MAG: delta-aminolevulinic acid dehydratase [Deltaproteobacteria bacterium RBG_16_64_85]|nr:MAG: delta-aminolevulinic acid dehydratase [Deltaproteobacteria bacterium RBG_16_64_85]
MNFPEYRPRRLRKNELFRRMVRETKLSVDDLICPLFAVAGKGIRKEVPSMPGVFQLSVENLVKEVKEVRSLGIPAILLFGIPAKKDPLGSDATSDKGIIQTAVRAIKDAVPGILVFTDVCFCEYTDHGHCGILTRDGDVDNDATLAILAESALSHARAGADMVAPSDMMDGRVAAIRQALDKETFTGTPIMSYAAKYASGFYGPFRDAAGSAPKSGDRRSYQMDPPNAREALREVAQDVREGADIVMVKPALAYLDILWRVREAFDLPVAAYNVSGEYSLVKAASKLGWVDGERVMMEILTGIKRAGADLILTYSAKEAAKILSR